MLNVMDAEADKADVPRLVRTTAFGVPGAGGLRTQTGSPAVVVLYANRLKDDIVRAIASDTAVETTAVYRATHAGADIGLRFWVPGGELSMCVHGLMGAVAALVREGVLRRPQCVIETKLGLVTAEWHQQGDTTSVVVDQWQPTFGKRITNPGSVLDALELSADDLDPELGPVQAVSVSRAKVFVPLKDSVTLRRARPVASKLVDVCTDHCATGVYAFTHARGRVSHDVEARQFPVGAGYAEDPATGVAAAGLAAYLVKHARVNIAPSAGQGIARYAILQGAAMGRPCLLEGIALLNGNRIVGTRVAGHAAVTV